MAESKIFLKKYLFRLFFGCGTIFLLLSAKKCCLMCAMLNPPIKLDLAPPVLLLFEVCKVDSQIVSILSAFCK